MATSIIFSKGSQDWINAKQGCGPLLFKQLTTFVTEDLQKGFMDGLQVSW